MELCLEILKLPQDTFTSALKAASTVEILSKIQDLEMLITSSFKEGRPLYHPIQVGAEVTQSMCELQIALIEELKRRQTIKEPGFVTQEVCAVLRPLTISKPMKVRTLGSTKDEGKLFGTVHKSKFWYVQDEQGRKFEIKELDDAGQYLSKHVMFHVNENDEAVDLEAA